MLSAMTKEDVEKFLCSVDLRSPLEEALNSAVSCMATEPARFFSSFFYAKELLLNLGSILATPCLPRSHPAALPRPSLL